MMRRKRKRGDCDGSREPGQHVLPERAQCLSHAPILRAYCLSDMYVQDINRTSRLGSQGRVVEAFADLLRQLHASQVCVRPEGFKKVLGKCKPQFAGSEQQDSQEFLTVRTRRPSST